MKTSSRAPKVAWSSLFTFFSIGGSSGDGGVTGTSFESLVTPGLLGKLAL